MRLRLIACALAASVLGLAAGQDAFAQTGPSARPLAPDAAQEAPRRAPAQRQLSRTERLDTLYQALKAAPNERAAQAVEARIEAMLLQSGSDTADLLMVRARTVLDAKEYDLSIELLDTIVELSPDFTEAYAQRATALFLKKDLTRALADLRVVIAREPRHYTALAGLGVILQDIGQDRLALEAFRRAVEQHPHLKGIPNLIKRLEPKVEGREI
jgi:tetratricopeptide (TPR) repeat protein